MDLSSAGRCALDLGTKFSTAPLFAMTHPRVGPAVCCYRAGQHSRNRPFGRLVRVLPNLKASALLTDLNSYVWTNSA